MIGKGEKDSNSPQARVTSPTSNGLSYRSMALAQSPLVLHLFLKDSLPAAYAAGNVTTKAVETELRKLVYDLRTYWLPEDREQTTAPWRTNPNDPVEKIDAKRGESNSAGPDRGPTVPGLDRSDK